MVAGRLSCIDLGHVLERWAKRKGVPADSWLGQMLARKPPMLVIVAVVNKNARIA